MSAPAYIRSIFKPYHRKPQSELRPYIIGEDMTGISVSPHDATNGSPQAGDWIARDPHNHLDQWLVSAKYFAQNFEEIS
jgi:hypothetical protein